MKPGITWRTVVADIRFWIAVFFLLRLVHITAPPIEVNHNWRQTGTMMTVRLFHENGVDLLRPETEIAGADRQKTVASEFPLYNFCIYLADRVFGTAEWYGRLINLVLSSLGIWSFFCVVRRWWNKEIALAAALLLMCSVWFLFARKIMPDVFSLSLVFLSVHAAWRFTGLRGDGEPVSAVSHGWLWWIAFVVCGTAGLLSKMPSLIVLCLLVPVLLHPGLPLRKKGWILAGGALMSGGMIAWYFVWVPHLIEHGAYQLYWPKSLAEGWRELAMHRSELALRFYFTSFYSYTAVLLLLSGIYFAFRKRWKAGAFFTASTLLMAFYMLKTGVAFPIQDYYILPFMPAMAILAAYGWSQLPWRKAAIGLLALAIIESVLNQQHDLRMDPSMHYKLTMKEDLDRIIPPGQPVAFVSDLNPSDMYFSHRAGWQIDPLQLADTAWVGRVCRTGGNYLVLNVHKPAYRLITPPFEELAPSGAFRIFRICP